MPNKSEARNPKYPLKGLVQKQAADRRRISSKTTLTLTLSRPTGEGTARPVSRSFQSGWVRRPTEDDTPSPIRWERAGVRVRVSQYRKLFLHVPQSGRAASCLRILSFLRTSPLVIRHFPPCPPPSSLLFKNTTFTPPSFGLLMLSR